MGSRNEKVRELIKQLAAEFISSESNRLSLITVTDVALTRNGKMATVLITVLPESAEKSALAFCKRKRREFREYLTERGRIPRVPFIDFDIDSGEKNRVRIDVISRDL